MFSKDPRNIDHNLFFAEKSLDKKIEFLLQYAVLAPSTHNSQPWRFKVQDSKLFLYPDNEINIKEADPEGRDLYESLGCLLENLSVMAKYFGVFERIEYFPHGSDASVACVYFRESKDRWLIKDSDPIIKSIMTRENARGIFSDEIPPAEFLSRLRALNNDPDLTIHTINEKEKIKKIAELTGKGIKIAYGDKKFRREMSRWMQSSFSSKRDGLPGYALKMPALISLILPKLIPYLDLGGLLSKLNYKSLVSAPIIVIVTSKNNDRASWLHVGELSERCFLECNKEGWQTSIFVASIEMGELYKETQKIIGTEERPQMLFCIGKVSGHKLTPRHSVHEKIMR